MPMRIPIIRVSVSDRTSRNNSRAATNVTTEKINPAIAPSLLFLGLTLGNSLCLPSAEPIKYAAESHTQIDAKIDIRNVQRIIVSNVRVCIICP